MQTSRPGLVLRRPPRGRSGESGADGRLASRHHCHNHLQTSGMGWLIAALLLIALAIGIFAG